MYFVVFCYLGKPHLTSYNEAILDDSIDVHRGFASIHIEKYLEKCKLKKADMYPVNVRIYKSNEDLKIAEKPICEYDEIQFIPILNK